MSSLIHHVRRHTDKWVSLVVGSLVFLLLVGPQVLSPSSTTWLRWGDSAQHYYGWEFFRRSPLLQFPLGDSPSFGLGYSSSVVYSDSIPLLAIPLKYLTFWFDADFQYFGFWLLFCYVAQHYVAALILREVGVSVGLSRLSAVFFVIAPFFLFRQTILGYGHFALVGHFLLLVGILLVVRGEFSWGKWLALLCIALLVQFYLFVMVLAFWGASTIQRLIIEQHNRRRVVGQFSLVGAVIAAVMLIVGYFSSGNSSEDGFGEFRADLATFIDPETVTTTKWSRWLPDQPVVPANTNGTFEGFAFLGIGVLFAVLIAGLVIPIVRVFGRQIKLETSLRNVGTLAPVALGMFVFSLSNVITFRVERLIVPIPTWAQWIGNTLRASGRFTWPLAYLIMLLAFSLLAKIPARRTVYVVLICLLGLQVVDSSRALVETRERFVQFDYPETILRSSQWGELAQGKSRLIIDPPQYKGNVWQDFAEFAINNRMGTNASYLSRVNYEQLYDSEVDVRNQLLTRKIRSDTLYVILPRSGAYQALRLSLEGKNGLLAPEVSARFIDGMLVIRRDD